MWALAVYGIALIVILPLAIVLIVRGRVLAARRQQEFGRWAAANRWIFRPFDCSIVDRFAGQPFGVGFNRRAANVVIGRHRGRPMIAFDYSFQTQSSNGKTTVTVTHVFTVAAIQLPVAFPWLDIHREGVLSGIGHALGLHDIELENDAFNKEFHVSSAIPKFAYDVLHPRMMEFLLHADGPDWRIAGHDLLCWGQGRAPLPAAAARLDYLGLLADQIPRFVWQNGLR